MNWNGVIGSVASVVNTALPLFFNLLADGARDRTVSASGASSTSASIGPATLYFDSSMNSLRIGNFHDSQAPVLLNFSHAEGDEAENLSVQLNFGSSFAAETWIQQYTDGQAAVGLATEPEGDVKQVVGLATASENDVRGDVLQGLYTFTTSAVMGISNTITAVVNPSLSLNLNLNISANNQVVAIVALGGATILGTTYIIRCTNNAGQSGTRSGTLQPDQATAVASDDPDPESTSFTIELPTGVDYTQGIYAFELQIPIDLESSSTASNAAVEFTQVDPKLIEAFKRR